MRNLECQDSRRFVQGHSVLYCNVLCVSTQAASSSMALSFRIPPSFPFKKETASLRCHLDTINSPVTYPSQQLPVYLECAVNTTTWRGLDLGESTDGFQLGNGEGCHLFSFRKPTMTLAHPHKDCILGFTCSIVFSKLHKAFSRLFKAGFASAASAQV